ncbi:Polyadenylate-binding protein 1 [Mycena indigotica]|uniref:Polyadenylate-binding protein 1 n=1 Tax=Mycena indigotica TaxID=2126181 RepID=A0A8H6VUM5_9AGAR|nr:Polyadenylate-binding protein 1 [Mycena indigotica]KAF7294557.1 Polyadenylate-binding protein 1 [Mycena indigotica]
MKAAPQLASPALFYDPPPPRIAETRIKTFFDASQLDVVITLVKPKRKRGFYRLEFADIHTAEKALATVHLQIIPDTDPPILLELSANPPRSKTPAQEMPQALPRSLRGWKNGLSAQELFDAFRHYGPIQSIHCDSITGALVQFWLEDHAKAAELGFNTANSSTKMVLEAYDPCLVFCSNIPFDINDTPTLCSYFETYGLITQIDLLRNARTGKSRGLALIQFSTASEASAAIHGMHGRELHSRKLALAYGRVKATKAMVEPAKTPTPPAHATINRYVSSPVPDSEKTLVVSVDPVANTNRCVEFEDVRLLSEAIYDKIKQQVEDDRLRREHNDFERATLQSRYDEEVSLRIAAQAGLKQLAENEYLRQTESAKIQARLEEERRGREKCEAENEHLQSCLERERTQYENELTTLRARLVTESKLRLTAAAQTAQLREELEETISQLEDEVILRAELQMQYDREEERRREVSSELERVRVELERVQRALVLTESQIKMAQLERDKPIWEKAKLKREAAEASQRRADDAAKRRNLEKIIADEKAKREAERQERIKKEQEERDRREREEKARLERERQEQERKLREEHERRQRWQAATAREGKRCRKRDQAMRGAARWTNSDAISRVKIIMVEFEKLKFSETQPLTLAAIPWPILIDPLQLELDAITWESVEKFFAAVKLFSYDDPTEYKTLVEKLHRMFHPDKWRSRGILSSVFNETLRAGIDAAGNSVAQALTPLWRESKGYV